LKIIIKGEKAEHDIVKRGFADLPVHDPAIRLPFLPRKISLFL
jgi:hypothetical protein